MHDGSHDRAHHSNRAKAMLDDLARAGLKMTPQRMAIVELFAVDESHPTAQALFERLQPAFPTMSFATVYNTLDALARAGLSSTLRLGKALGQAARFDPNTTPHHHAVCDVCGVVRDVPVHGRGHAPGHAPGHTSGHAGRQARGDVGRRRVARADQEPVPGFEVRTVERIYRGACSACASK